VAPSAGLRSAWTRLSGPDRLGGVDLARGLAVLGMIAAHLLVIPPFDLSDVGGTWTDVVNGRSSILFATLAGVSIALTTGGPHPVAGAARRDARVRLALRAGMLWMLGIALTLLGVPVFVILPAYAILFLLSLPLLALRASTLLLLAGGVAVVLPFLQALLGALPFWATPAGELVALAVGWHYPFPTWIAFLAAGMGLGRLPLRGVTVPALALLLGAAAAALAYAAAGVFGTVPVAGDPWSRAWSAAAHSTGVFEVVGGGGVAIATIGACLLVCRTPATWIVLPLRAVGSMPLTAYTAQLLVWAVWALVALGGTGNLALFRLLDPFWPVAIGIVVGCTAWALLLGRGPLERLVDLVTRLPARPVPVGPA
jgi:uncharacterized membrane protein